MMVIAPDGHGAAVISAVRERIVAGITIVGWILLIGFVVSLYVGHSSSPYGVCYAASGRDVPCELTSHR